MGSETTPSAARDPSPRGGSLLFIRATLPARSYTVPVLRGRRLYARTAKPVARHSKEHTHASHASQCSGDRPRHRHYSTRTRSSRARRRSGEPQAQGGGGCAIRCTRRDGAVLLSPPHPPPSLPHHTVEGAPSGDLEAAVEEGPEPHRSSRRARARCRRWQGREGCAPLSPRGARRALPSRSSTNAERGRSAVSSSGAGRHRSFAS